MTKMIFDFRAEAERVKEENNLQTYDTALDIRWCDDVKDKTGFFPYEYGFIWGYTEKSVWGQPYPLTPAAEILLTWYNKEVGNNNG